MKDKYNSFPSDLDNELVNLTTDYFEYESGQADIIVKGRLRENIQFWRDIGAPQFILDTIMRGYLLPFYSNPDSFCLQNNQSALNNSDFVDTAINDLLLRGLIIETTNIPLAVNPLTVSIQSNGKKRLILDLREINRHLYKQSVKFEDIKTAQMYINEGSYMFKFDIHSAYHHIDIYEPHTEYLGFSWVVHGVRKYYKFLVLPFGLSTACYLYTKLTRPLIKKWRGEGKQVVMYLDDGLGVHDNSEMCENMALQVKTDLLNSGFVPKAEKSMWSPTQELVWLGTSIDTNKGLYMIPEARIAKIFETISIIERSLRLEGRVFIRKIASLVGQIISTSLVFGNLVYLMTKHISIDISSAPTWYCNVTLSEDSVQQISFWKENLPFLNVKPFKRDFACHTLVYSDASDTGFGGYSVENPHSIAHGMWSDTEKRNSSTWKELTAVYKVFSSLYKLLQGKNVKWLTDNQNVVRIVSRGSTKTVLQKIALDIFNICLRSNVNLDVVWIPRDDNERADYLSRIVDLDDWGISYPILEMLESLWGPHEIDWFASDDNHKLPIFYSRFWNMYSIGVDAFTIDWNGINGLFVPPVCLISRVLVYMRQCRAYGTLVLPHWPSASFWPLLCPTGEYFIDPVKFCVDLPTSKQFYIPGKSKKSIFGNVDLSFRMLALRLDFSRS